MDRMEQRQDSMESTLASLSGTVARVESNQNHAEELNKLRFDGMKTSIDTLTGTVGAFIARIEGIIDGSVQTNQTRQGAEVMAAYLKFVERTNARLDAIEDEGSPEAREAAAAAAAALVKITALETAAALKEAKGEGVRFVLSGGRAVLVTLAALAGPVIAIVALIIRSTPAQ
jgi:hypothetical protein